MSKVFSYNFSKIYKFKTGSSIGPLSPTVLEGFGFTTQNISMFHSVSSALLKTRVFPDILLSFVYQVALPFLITPTWHGGHYSILTWRDLGNLKISNLEINM